MEVLLVLPEEVHAREAEETLRGIGRRAALLDAFSETRHRRHLAEMKMNFAGDERKFIGILRYISERSDQILQESDERMRMANGER